MHPVNYKNFAERTSVKNRESLMKKTVSVKRKQEQNKQMSSKKSKQLKITDYSSCPAIMSLCVELAVVGGRPFKMFGDRAFGELVRFAKAGCGDYSTNVISPRSVKDTISIVATTERVQIKNKLKNKIVSLSADLATCQGRSFIGKFNVVMFGTFSVR